MIHFSWSRLIPDFLLSISLDLLGVFGSERFTKNDWTDIYIICNWNSNSLHFPKTRYAVNMIFLVLLPSNIDISVVRCRSSLRVNCSFFPKHRNEIQFSCYVQLLTEVWSENEMISPSHEFPWLIALIFPSSKEC